MSDTSSSPAPTEQAQLSLLPPNAPGLSTQDVRTLLGLVTEDEFGRAIGVVGATIAIWRNKGEGPPFYRFRRNIFYRTADIVQWVIENTWDPRTGERLMPEASTLPVLGVRKDPLSGNRPEGRSGDAQEIKSSLPPAGQHGAVGDHVPSVG